MKTVFVLILISLFISPITVFSQPASMDVSTIPEAIKKNASVVKRYENIVFEVTDVDRATYNVHEILTVFSEAGKRALTFVSGSDKFRSLDEVEIKVYDGDGKSLARYKRKDINTVAIADGLIDDSKTHYFTVPFNSYPLTVEYKYQVNYRGTLNYPSYYILTPGEGLENSSYTAKISRKMDLRFKEKNIKLPPVIKEDEKFKTYTWSTSNMPSYEYEEGSGSNYYPVIKLAPNLFKMDDYEGDMSSWNKFGNWYSSLLKGSTVLTESRKEFFRELVKSAKDDKEKARILFDYLQKNFRYVSIQLGIGGWRPFPASFTDQKKYGDCKGLSNYMQAALEVVGIKSYQALINRKENDEAVDPDFPMNEFNHAILFVPFNKDSVWLECTSKTLEFGSLDNTTENRNALVVTEKGGVLLPTPRAKAELNKFSAVTTIKLESNGSGTSQTTITPSGEYKQDFINYLFDEKQDDQKEFIVNYLGFKHADQVTITKKLVADGFVAEFDQTFQKIPEFVAGSKMFLAPKIYKLWSSNLPKAEKRKQDFHFPHPFDKTDTTIFKLPEGYKPDALPQAKNLTSEFASYTTKYWYDEQEKSIYGVARLKLIEQKIPAAKYQGVKTFFDDVLMDNSQRIVIKKE